MAGVIPAEDHSGCVRDFFLRAPGEPWPTDCGTMSHSGVAVRKPVADHRRFRDGAMRASVARRRSWTKNPFPLLCHRDCLHFRISATRSRARSRTKQQRIGGEVS